MTVPQDLGYKWIVHSRRGDLPPVAQGYSTKKTSAHTIIELILLSEDLAERGELTGPRGKVWTCWLGDAAGVKDPKGRRPIWEPERP